MNHPEIENALRTGYPHGEPAYPQCPVCEAEADTFFKDHSGTIVGCENCISKVDAWEEMEDEYF